MNETLKRSLSPVVAVPAVLLGFAAFVLLATTEWLQWTVIALAFAWLFVGPSIVRSFSHRMQRGEQ